MSKQYDLICLGRASVDLYAQQIGSRLEDVSSFAKYLGGSSCNIATGTARQGLKVSMLTRVGKEQMGNFVRETLVKERVDTSHVVIDDDRLTALVILGIKDKETFPLIFYRENCADMAISADDFDESYIASAKALVITGTHLSMKQVCDVSKTALGYARANGVKTVLDIDYRPVLWGLADKGDGETRYISNANVSSHLQSMLQDFDLIVGTEEEIHIAGGTNNTIDALNNIRNITQATLVVKRGVLGASVFSEKIPLTLDQGITIAGVTVEVLNVLGAGDAFMSGFLRGWLNDENYLQCLRYANACGALVVSRHGCTPAMPTKIELDDYLSRAEDVKRPDLDEKLQYLHKVTTPRQCWGELCILAFDHRIQLYEIAKAVGADVNRIKALKLLLLQAAVSTTKNISLQGRAGVLIDETYGIDALNEITGEHWWIGRPVEQPKSYPLTFEYGDNIGQQLQTWPLEHVVKCLVFYQPEDEMLVRNHQEEKLKSLYEACLKTGHELLLEIIPPQGCHDNETVISRSIERFYHLGIKPEWWKLPALSEPEWSKLDKIIQHEDEYCRGVLILGLDKPLNELIEIFKLSRKQRLCKGFAIGRTIFSEPSRQWLSNDIDDDQLIDAISKNYMAVIEAWQASSQ